MVGDPWRAAAPGPLKARHVARALRESTLPLDWVAPEPATRADLHRTHDPDFVDAVLACKRTSAFGTLSEELARSLPYTCGAVYTSALLALEHGLSTSLTCGFHHAQYDRPRSYCTFNGLVVASQRLLVEARVQRIAILDCDYHYGDGTDALIQRHGLGQQILHESLGRRFRAKSDARAYLKTLAGLDALFGEFAPEVILYQAGVDVHLEDPLGGMLTTEEMHERDRLVFGYAHNAGIPVAWNLAGGYQVEPDGTHPKMVSLHLNTFRAALEVFMPAQHVVGAPA
jgi:acetoin utilization deacetylase AcuC-like enzyme